MARPASGKSKRFLEAKEKFEKKKVGRPTKELNFSLIEAFLCAGCSVREISPHFGVYHQTLYQKIEEEYGVPANDFIEECKQKRNGLIRKKQFDKATEGIGDTTLLIWLGKQYLDQRETPNEITVSPQTVSHFEDLMKQIRTLQSSANNDSSNKSIPIKS